MPETILPSLFPSAVSICPVLPILTERSDVVRSVSVGALEAPQPPTDCSFATIYKGSRVSTLEQKRVSRECESLQ